MSDDIRRRVANLELAVDLTIGHLGLTERPEQARAERRAEAQQRGAEFSRAMSGATHAAHQVAQARRQR